MGDRCYMQITLHQRDMDRFAAILSTPPGEPWWDEEIDEPAAGLVRVALNEANYALYDEREEAARVGVPFLGWHGDGGDYGGYAFASLRGVQREAPINRDGDLELAVDRDLMPLNGTRYLRLYVAKARAVERVFGIEEEAA